MAFWGEVLWLCWGLLFHLKTHSDGNRDFKGWGFVSGAKHYDLKPNPWWQLKEKLLLGQPSPSWNGFLEEGPWSTWQMHCCLIESAWCVDVWLKERSCEKSHKSETVKEFTHPLICVFFFTQKQNRWFCSLLVVMRSSPSAKPYWRREGSREASLRPFNTSGDL